MTITKYEHACLVITEGDNQAVIDPGIFSVSLPSLKNVVVTVITHINTDHFDKNTVKQLITDNPDVKIFSTQEVAEANKDLRIIVAEPGSVHKVDGFTLAFFGGQHATIHHSKPPAQNIGVLVNTTLYYPGDSFVLPGRPISILAAPAAAPWLRIGEAMDFLMDVKAERAFPTHDAILSKEGQQVYDSLLQPMAKTVDTMYERLTVGQSITV